MVYVVETENSIVKQIIPFMNSPCFNAMEAAETLAKNLCVLNGIKYEGKVSCDFSPRVYTVQVVEQ